MVIIKFYKDDKEVKKFKHKLSKIIENMKTFYRLLNYINYIVTASFLILLLVGVVLQINAALAIALYAAFFLGIYQVSSSVLLWVPCRKMNFNNRKYLMLYQVLVAVYFSFWFVFTTFLNNLMSIISFFLIATPVVLSIFFTFLSRKITLQL